MPAQSAETRRRSSLKPIAWQCAILLLITSQSPFGYYTAISANRIAQDDNSTPVLKPDAKPITRELGGGAAHDYRVKLSANDFLRLTVEQKGVDVIVTLLDPQGRKLVEVDSPNGSDGPELLTWVAQAPGDYKLTIGSADKNAPSGRYELRVEELRAATSKDKSRVGAQQALLEAMRFEAEQTAESLKKAIAKYEEALALGRAGQDSKFEVLTLNNLGQVYYLTGDRKKALELFLQSLSMMQAQGDKYGEATALSNLAATYEELGDPKKAFEYYDKALPLRRAAGDKTGEGVTLSNIGYLLSHTGEYRKAIEYFEQSLAIMRAIGNRQYEAVALNNLAGTYQDLGEIDKALAYYNQAQPIFRALADASGESSVYNGMGNVYYGQGDNEKAREYYRRALELARQVGDPGKVVSDLANIATTYDTGGEKQKALEYFNQALELARKVGEPRNEAQVLSNLGVLYNSIDENDQALDYFDKALAVLEAVGDRSGQATTLNNIGAVYDALGEWKKALEYYEKSLALVRAIDERRTEGVLLDNIGAVYKSEEDDRKALELHTQAVAIARSVGDKATLATALRNVAIADRSLGDTRRALDALNEALENARAVGNPRLIGSSLNNLGETYLLAGEPQKALDYYNQSLPLWRGSGDFTGEAGALYGLARSTRDLGEVSQARIHIEAALKIVEALRVRVRRQELRASYFATVQKYYDFYIDLLMRLHRLRGSAGNDALALQASERARARLLLDMLVEAHADIRQGVDPTLLERERSLQQLISAKAESQMRLLSGKHTDQQAARAASEVATLVTQYQEVETQIRQSSPRYAALTQPQPLGLKEIQQQVLDDETVLLEYALGEERSYLWVATSASLRSYELPKRAEIEKAARALYALLTEPNQPAPKSDPRRGLRVARVGDNDQRITDAILKLSRIVIAPAAPSLGAKRLLIVADGALQYVPFAALSAATAASGANATTQYRPLIADHEVISLPSASALAVLRRELVARRPAAKTVAVLADPVFALDDERLKSGSKASTTSAANRERGLLVKAQKSVAGADSTGDALDIPRLPGTKQEAQRILSFAQESERKQALDFAANKATATNDELGQYRYVHFATHGFLDSVNPELSGIVLSLVDERGAPQSGFLRAHELYNLKLPVEMVVLSACQTGLGKEIRGEGLVGLTRGFMYAGTARVVVSLWSVDDEATSDLMGRFYKGVLKDGLRPAAALRDAQVEVWKQRKWRAPYFWAAFVLQGEWK
ncbi:MAG TPA: CHAT domain-containing tetratricopeptide repeat protein [Blastocatellia bacterium]|nr:CHAT domain-containing tetratricopeptide repeat protein [Blastocatellia bacterium]